LGGRESEWLAEFCCRNASAGCCGRRFVWRSAFALAYLSRRRTGFVLLFLALAIIGCDVAAGQIRSDHVAALVLPETISSVEVRGCLVESGIGEGMQRYILDELSIAGVAADDTPQRVYITVHVPSRLAEGGTPSARRPVPGGSYSPARIFALAAWPGGAGGVGLWPPILVSGCRRGRLFIWRGGAARAAGRETRARDFRLAAQFTARHIGPHWASVAAVWRPLC